MREFVYYSKSAVTAGNGAQLLYNWEAHASHGWLTSWVTLRYNRRMAHCSAMGTCPFEGGFIL